MPLDILSRVYESAASAGLLTVCIWHRPNDVPVTHHVGLRAPDDSVLDHLTRSKDTTISYPCTIFIGLKTGETVELLATNRPGQRYQVREVPIVRACWFGWWPPDGKFDRGTDIHTQSNPLPRRTKTT